MMQLLRKTLITSVSIAAVSIAVLAGCSSTTSGSDSTKATTPASSGPTAPVVNIPAAITGEIARTTYSGSGAPSATSVTPSAAGISYVVKAQCGSTAKTDTLTYTVTVGGKAATGTGATGKITCDGTPLLAPTEAIPAGSAVTVVLDTPPAGVKVAFAIVEPSQ
jgi:hypothetical protein